MTWFARTAVQCTCGIATTDMTQQRPWGGDRKRSGEMGIDRRTNTELPRINKQQFERMPECDFS